VVAVKQKSATVIVPATEANLALAMKAAVGAQEDTAHPLKASDSCRWRSSRG